MRERRGLGRGEEICNRGFNWIKTTDKRKVHNVHVLSLTFKIM